MRPRAPRTDGARGTDGARALERLRAAHAALLALALPVAAQAPPRGVELRPGLRLRVWDVAEPLERLPEELPARRPQVDATAPRVELFGPDAFGGAVDTFVAALDGWIETGAGVLSLRLSSDDGSALWLDGELVLANDGLHAHAGVEGSVELAAGRHALHLRYFENLGAQSLLLEWRKPGTYEFDVVPDAAFEREVDPLALFFAQHDGPGSSAALLAEHPSYARGELWIESAAAGVLALAPWSDGAGGTPALLALTRSPRGGRGPGGELFALDLAGTAGPVRARRLATGLEAPRGVATLGERVFALSAGRLLEIAPGDDGSERRTVRDLAGDGAAAPGLAAHDGALFAALLPRADGGDAGGGARLVRIDPDTGELSAFAAELAAPGGVGSGPRGGVLVADRAPAAGTAAWGALVRFDPALAGADGARPRTLALVPPVAGDVRLGQPVLAPPGPHAGQVVVGDAASGVLWRVFVEDVDGSLQGAALPLGAGPPAGVSALAVAEDGSLWTAGADAGALARLARGRAPAHEPAHEIVAVRAFANGFEVQLGEPLARRAGFDPLGWSATRVRPAEGAPPEPLFVRSSAPDEDRLRVLVEVEGLAEGDVVHLHATGELPAESGRALRDGEAWYALARLPRGRHPGFLPDEPWPNALTPEEAEQGWRLLFDGESLAGWRGFRREKPPEGWSVAHGAVTLAGPAGDLVTREEFGDFELAFQWRVTAGSTGGVLFRVSEEAVAASESGAEMGLADDARALPLRASGSAPGLYPPRTGAALPTGRWNHSLLRVFDARVEHWIEGVKVLEYRLDDPARAELLTAAGLPPALGSTPRGHVALRDGGTPIAFRGLKVREL